MRPGLITWFGKSHLHVMPTIFSFVPDGFEGTDLLIQGLNFTYQDFRLFNPVSTLYLESGNNSAVIVFATCFVCICGMHYAELPGEC